jgi:hypothetical protein
MRDAYIVAGKPKPERNWLYCRLVETKLELQDLERKPKPERNWLYCRLVEQKQRNAP